MQAFSILVALMVALSVCHGYHFPRNVAAVARKTMRISAKLPEVPANESEADRRARLAVKARKMMYNENGVPYAPWVTKQINMEAIIDDLIRKEEQGEYQKKATSSLDRGEVETSEGMKWRMAGSEVELGWITGEESLNKGYIVEKRPSYGGDFQEIASFQEVTQLVSKGLKGGKYRYTDPSTAAGSWIYRVKDCDVDGKTSVLCQCFVEVQTMAESKTQSIITIGFVAFFLAALAVGYSVDPPQ